MSWKQLYRTNLITTYEAVKTLYQKKGVPFLIPYPELNKIEKKNDILEFNNILLKAIKHPEYHYLAKNSKFYEK